MILLLILQRCFLNGLALIRLRACENLPFWWGHCFGLRLLALQISFLVAVWALVSRSNWQYLRDIRWKQCLIVIPCILQLVTLSLSWFCIHGSLFCWHLLFLSLITVAFVASNIVWRMAYLFWDVTLYECKCCQSLAAVVVQACWRLLQDWFWSAHDRRLSYYFDFLTVTTE